MADSRPSISTLAELRAAGWQSRPIKQEIREHTLEQIRRGATMFPGVQGYDDTVIPQLQHALLAKHDMVLLGERGQAKTRIIRSLTSLLDPWMPIVAGSEINDDPCHPVSRHALDLISEKGEETPIAWVHHSDRYGEKLATPDTSIADLIGEVDPIKVAEGRYLSDELTLHYGMVPRTNRGIFAINELPDLAERIQVGLLNVLEERDVQIRGYKVRLPLDVMLVASANPEDYTNRGRMITPLKDRFGAQIRTHYPYELDTEAAVVTQEAFIPDAGLTVRIPDFMSNVIVRFTHLARSSGQVNQRSGVSVRMSVSNMETLAAAATARALRLGEDVAIPRVCDLDAIFPSSAGKIEIESLDEGRDTEILDLLLNAAIVEEFQARVDGPTMHSVAESFDDDTVVSTGNDIPAERYAAIAAENEALASAAAGVAGDAGAMDPEVMASAIEFVLEGMHLTRRLNKDAVGGRASFRIRY
ncbi:MAG: sigma 54-interacting transcriptional regulator [Acidimicrobiales bacterium]|nr:sigma 54-interacting transcriptional regulator [Acidimicrobiales bacterium]